MTSPGPITTHNETDRRFPRMILMIFFVGFCVFVTIRNTALELQGWQSQMLESVSFRKPTTLMDADLTDPEHTPRLKRFENMDDFPVPRFHGCGNGYGVCHFSNVCFSRHNNMLVLDVPGLEDDRISVEPNWYLNSSDYYETMSVAPIRQPLLVPQDNYTSFTKVYFAKKIFVMNCWQQTMGHNNPSHMMMGMGKLFAQASGIWDKPGVDHDKFDLLLFHQCSPVEGWPWGEYVSNIIWKDAVARKSVYPPRDHSTMYVPYIRDSDDRQDDDLIICGETVHQEPHASGTYFDTNEPEVISRWRNVVNKEIEKDPVIQQYLAKNDASRISFEAFPDDPKSCSRKLRIAAFQRSEGSARRLFRNIDDIKRLVEEYTDEEFVVLTATSTTASEKQAANFRSFDILLTPHGSHLVNMIFSTGKSVFIEISAVYYDGGPKVNGLAFARDWLYSFGHLPFNNSELASRVPDCLAKGFDRSLDGTCPLFAYRLHLIQSDLVVNTDILRNDLEKAITLLCPGFSK